MDRINIVHLITAWRQGLYGGERVVLNLASSIDPSRFNTTIVAFGDDKDGIPLLKAASAKGITVDVVPSRAKYDIRGVFDIRRIIVKHKADILHCHGYKSDVLGMLAASFGKTRLITTLHGWWVGDSPKARFHNLLDMYSVRYFDKIVVVSPALLEGIKKRSALYKKTELILNCVDTAKFETAADRGGVRADFGIPRDALVLGTVSRLTEEKGHIYLLSAVAGLRATGRNAYLIIAGEGPLENALKARAAELGLEKYVIFAGFREDVSGIISALDMFLMPSISEGLPMAVLEAMAAGKPVIATGVGGIPSVIRDRQTGIIIKPKDADSIKKAVIDLLEGGELPGIIALNARRFIKENYSLDSMAAHYEKAYLEVLGK